MSDRFKFRLWDERYGEYYSVSYLKSTGELVGEYLHNGIIVLNQQHGEGRFTVEQCTGLKDCNGTLIYEGDLVRGSFGIPPLPVGSVVEWKNGVFGIATKYVPKWAHIGIAMECLDLEVIGNIHQHHELLEQ